MSARGKAEIFHQRHLIRRVGALRDERPENAGEVDGDRPSGAAPASHHPWIRSESARLARTTPFRTRPLRDPLRTGRVPDHDKLGASRFVVPNWRDVADLPHQALRANRVEFS
jgi:hypothetical protein